MYSVPAAEAGRGDRNRSATGKQTPGAAPGSPGSGGGAGPPFGDSGRGARKTLPPPGSLETPETAPSPPPAGSCREQSGRRTLSPAPPCLPPSRRSGGDHRWLQPRTAPAAALRPSARLPEVPAGLLTASGFRRQGPSRGLATPCGNPGKGRARWGSSPPMRQLLKEHATQRPWPQALNTSFVWGREEEGCLLFKYFPFIFSLTREGLNWIAWSFKFVVCAAHKKINLKLIQMQNNIEYKLQLKNIILKNPLDVSYIKWDKTFYKVIAEGEGGGGGGEARGSRKAQ